MKIKARPASSAEMKNILGKGQKKYEMGEMGGVENGAKVFTFDCQAQKCRDDVVLLGGKKNPSFTQKFFHTVITWVLLAKCTLLRQPLYQEPVKSP